MDFKAIFHAACLAKRKELGRLLVASEVFAIGCECHEAVSKQAKAPRASTSIAAGAEQVYALYPLKVGKEAALRAISVQLKKHELSYLLDKTNQFALAVKSWPSSYRYMQDGGDRCPHASTFFNQGRYADDPHTWKRHGARHPAPNQYIPPQEPEGWRRLFPEFVDRDKPWNQLQQAQHQFIINALSVAQTSTQPAKDYAHETRLRSA